MQQPVLDHPGAQHDAAVEIAVRPEIAHPAGIGAARFRLQPGDDFARANLGRAADSSGGKAREHGVDGIVMRGVELPDHVGDDVHHMAVAFDGVAVGHADGAGLGHAAHIVAAQIQQHQVFGAFLGIGQQADFVGLVLFRRLAARTGAGDRPDRHFAIAHADQDFGA